MSNGTQVIKRNGKVEPLDLNKLHLMVDEACKDLAGVSASQVEMSSGIQLYDGITTSDIQEILIRSASDLISLDSPNYQFVAARLLLFSVRKSLYGKVKDHPTLYDHIQRCVGLGVYDSQILNEYTEEELNRIGGYIDHHRDYLFTYAGLRQVVDKYLVQDRITGQIYETPQFAYMMIAATLFAKYPKATRISYVKRYYDAISKHKINLPTPIFAGVRTILKQFASCVLVDIDDTLDSIGHSDMAIFKYVAQRAGIGINSGRIRGINSNIRGGEVIHTGVIPFLKKSEATVRSCTQNGIRGGSATVHFPIWHQEIEDILVLKNNKGTEDNRVRKLDYSIQFSKLFYERFIQNGDITLFSPHNVPGLYDSFGLPGFDELYVRYENDPTVPKKTVKAQELFLDFIKERAETGRIYFMNIDHCNSHSSYLDHISMSNLCQEITEPTTPIQHIDSTDGEIATCILSAINVGKIRSDEEFEDVCDLVVRGLEEIIDYQDYPVPAAESFTKNRRSLGIGFIGVAHYFARLGYSYESQEAWDAMHGLAESLQYFLLKSSNQIAQEKGPCAYYHRTKYSQGLLPIDTYKKEVDNISNIPLQHDWEALRELIRVHGLRHSTLTAQMPSESSSVVSNATNGIEPPRAYMSVKLSKKGPLKQIVPQYQTLKHNYTLLWEMENNRGYINTVAVQQKFTDQGISGNVNYNPGKYSDGQVPISEMVGDLLYQYSVGWKTGYYHNTNDGKEEGKEEVQEPLANLISELLSAKESECESCTI